MLRHVPCLASVCTGRGHRLRQFFFHCLLKQPTLSPPRLEDEQEVLGASLTKHWGPPAEVVLSKAMQLVAGVCLLSSRLESAEFPSKDLILCRSCITFLDLKLCQGEMLWERGNPLLLSSNYPA